VVQAGRDKVHGVVEFSRFGADGSVRARSESLYIVSKLDDRWGVRAWSSHAP
jgi:hypothetical protein